MSAIVSSPLSRGVVGDDRSPRHSEARGSEQVCKDSSQRESGFDSRQGARRSALDRARPKIKLLVKEQESLIDSRMLAYEAVGRIFGRGESWVRRLLSGVAVAFSADQQEALQRAYVAYCRRVESHAAAVRAEADARWGVVYEIDAGLGPAADGSGIERTEQAGSDAHPGRSELGRRDSRR